MFLFLALFTVTPNKGRTFRLGKNPTSLTLIKDKCVDFFFLLSTLKDHIPSKRSSAQVGIWVNSVLTRKDCIKCCRSLFKEIILQQFDAFQTEIQGSLTKLCAFKASRGHSSKVVKLPVMSPGAENMEYLNNP